MSWLPLDPDLLRIGLFIKVDHSWMEHPFVRNIFTVSSPTEIVIIRKHRLTKLFYDPERSHADAVAALQDPVVPGRAFEIDAETEEGAKADERTIVEEKQRQIQTVVDHRKAIGENARSYDNATNQVSVIMTMANAGQPETLFEATTVLDAMANVLEQEEVAISLVSTESQAAPEQTLAMQAINVSTLSTLTAKTLGFTREEMNHIGLGALFHNVGMSRIPLAIRLKSEEDMSPTETKLLRMYPQLGKEMLEAIPGMAPQIIEIVHQHREWLDGTGYPNRLTNGDIPKTARLVGTVVEYNMLTSDSRSPRYISPSQALSYLFTKMLSKYGSDVIEPFIATVTVFPPGSFVELNDGSFGLVLKSNSTERLRPVIMLYERDASHGQAAIIDLARERSLSVEKSLDPKKLPERVKDVLLPTKLNGYVMTAK